MTERWSFAAGHVPDVLVLGVVALCAALAAAEGIAAFRRPRTVIAGRIALAMLALRFTAVLALIAIAFELTLRVEQVSPTGRRVVVLVDRSASMAVPDAPEADKKAVTRQSRAEQIWEASSTARAAWERDGLVVDVRGFDARSVPYDGELARTLATEPIGAASDLAGALTELAEPDPSRHTPVVGVVVISDGLVAEGRSAEGHLRAVADSLALPMTTASVGAPHLVDVSVAEIRAGEFAFVENVTEIDATVIAHGLRGKVARVELRRDGRTIHQQPLTLTDDGVPQTVRFEVAPDRVGQFVYEIAVTELPGEATTENNTRAFVVKVLRDKVRVLHVAGRPDWDVRALRTLLRRDPNVELLSYYILRGFDDIGREDTTAPLSLIPFPTEELFEQELGSFDLVVLHNFDALQHQVGQYVDNMAEYVAQGGALVLIGGDLGLSDGAYAPLSPLLPVDVGRPSTIEHQAFRPGVTEAGQRHPITAWLQADGGDWATLPELDTFNPLQANERGMSIGATALLVHPGSRDKSGEPRPLLAVAEPGKGRTMVLATGSTWKLGFAPDLPLIDGARPYDLLWLGAVRWLLRDISSGRLTLETDKPRYRVGEAVDLQAKTLTAAYAPEPDIEVTWELLPLQGGADSQSESVEQGRWTTDGLGRAHQRLPDLPVGAYAAVARRSLDAGTTGEDADGTPNDHEVRRVFIVEPPGRELARIDADPGIARLRALAEATGGAFVSGLEGENLPDDLPVADLTGSGDPRVHVEGRSDIPLWNGWPALLVLLAAFGGEWLLRRRYGER